MSVLRSVMTGAGAYLPEKRVTNEDLTRIVETTDAWITERTGILSLIHISEPTRPY